MKKILSIALSIVMILSIGLCMAGCDSDTDELNKQIAELQTKLTEQTEKIAQLEEDIAAEQKKSEELQASEQEKNKALQAELDKLKNEHQYLLSLLSDYMGGTFYNLGEAYDLGLITQDNVCSIVEAYETDFGTGITSEDYEAKMIAEVGEIAVLAVKKTAVKNETYRDITVDDVEIYGYYGEYSGKLAVRIAGWFGWGTAVIYHTVAGITYGITGPDLQIWVPKS